MTRLPDVVVLLDSLQAQSYPYFEVIFVGENDPALCDAVSHHATAIGLRSITVLYNVGERGASAARNLGLKSARGEIIAFIDDDAVAAPNWLQEIVETFAVHDVAGVVGAAEPVWENPSLGWVPRELYWLIGCTGWLEGTGLRETAQGATVNISYHREAIAAAGPFSTVLGPVRGGHAKAQRWRDGSGEDIEFARRVRRVTGKPLVFNPAVRVGHKVPQRRLTMKPIAQRAWATGWSRHMLQRFYGGEDASVARIQRGLLARILTRLLPVILLHLLIRPRVSWKQLRLTLVSLACVAGGYLSFPIDNPYRRGRRQVAYEPAPTVEKP